MLTTTLMLEEYESIDIHQEIFIQHTLRVLRLAHEDQTTLWEVADNHFDDLELEQAQIALVVGGDKVPLDGSVIFVAYSGSLFCVILDSEMNLSNVYELGFSGLLSLVTDTSLIKNIVEWMNMNGQHIHMHRQRYVDVTQYSFF